MRRTLAGIGLWIGAAVVAVVVAFQGVNVVGDQVTDERPAALAASDIEQRLADAATSTTSSSTTVEPGPTTTLVAPTTSPPATTTPSIAAPPSSAAPPPAPPTTVPPAVTRTYTLVGGTAVLRFSPAGVEVVFATPNQGFTVEEEPEHGNGVKVEFESDSHESRVDGWWDGGPQDRVQEQPED